MRTLEAFKILHAGGLLVEHTTVSGDTVYKMCAPINDNNETLVIASASAQLFELLKDMLEPLPYVGKHTQRDIQYTWYRLRQPIPAVIGKTPQIDLIPVPQNVPEVEEQFTEEEQIVEEEHIEEVPLLADTELEEITEIAAEEVVREKADKKLSPEEHWRNVRYRYLMEALTRMKAAAAGTYQYNFNKYKQLDMWLLLRCGALICEISFPTEEARAACPYAPETGNVYNIVSKPINGKNRLCGRIKRNFFQDLFRRGLITAMPLEGTHRNGAHYRWYRLSAAEYTSITHFPGVKFFAPNRTDNISKV